MRIFAHILAEVLIKPPTNQKNKKYIHLHIQSKFS